MLIFYQRRSKDNRRTHSPQDSRELNRMTRAEFQVSVAMVFFGFGTGFVFMATALAAQSSVDLPRMGVATGLINFTRQLGGAVGVAAASAVMLSGLTSRLTDAFPNQSINTAKLLGPGGGTKGMSAAAQELVRVSFAGALHQDPHDVLFVSDVIAELDAARAAGMQTVLAQRDAAPESPTDHPRIRSFDELA